MIISEVKTPDFTPAKKPTIVSKICDLNLRVAKAAITAFVAISCYGAIVGCVAGCLFMGATISFTAAQVFYNSMVNALGNGILSSINNPFKFYSQVYDYLWVKRKAQDSNAAIGAGDAASTDNAAIGAGDAASTDNTAKGPGDAEATSQSGAPLEQTAEIIIVHNYYSYQVPEKRTGFFKKLTGRLIRGITVTELRKNLIRTRASRFSNGASKIRAAGPKPAAQPAPAAKPGSAAGPL